MIRNSLMSLLALSFLAVSPAQAMEPIDAGSARVVDLPVSEARTVSLDIEDARFDQRSVNRVHLTATGIDFRNGLLEGLKARINDGHFDHNIEVTEFLLTTSAFEFNTMELLNNQRFVLFKPVLGQVTLRFSEANLNHFFSHPDTIGRIEKALARQTGGLKLFTFAQPKFQLGGDGQVRMDVMLVAGQSVGAPLTMTGRLKVKDHKLVFDDLEVSSAQTMLPVDVARVFEKELNKLIDLEKLNGDDFRLRADSLTMDGDTLKINGRAALTKLELGRL